MEREVTERSVNVAFTGGGPLDGDTKKLPIFLTQFKVPIPRAQALVAEGDLPETGLRVYLYERKVFKDTMSGSSYTKMVYVGERDA